MMAIARIATRGRLLVELAAVAALIGGLLVRPAPVHAATGTELFMSEYVEGTGTNRAIELYNPTDVAVSLGASGYMLAFFLDGSGAIGGGVPLAGTVQPGKTWVVTPTNASAALLARANQRFGTAWFDGNDAVALIHGGVAIDVIGQIGVNPGTAWGAGATSTADHTLRRKASVTGGDPNGSDPFDPAVEWDGFPADTFDGLGSIGGTVNQPMTITCPGPMSTTQGFALGAPVTSTDPDGAATTMAVTAVSPSDPGTIAVAGVVPAGAPGGTATGSFSVSAATPVGVYTATVTAWNADAIPQSASCTVAVTVTPVTTGTLSALVDQLVADGGVSPEKARLLTSRLDRVADAVAHGRTAEAAAQLRALVNQAHGLSPRWVSPGAADLIAEQAALLAGTL